MAQITIYDQETNNNLRIIYTLNSAILDDTTTGDIDYYLTITTTIKKTDGSSFPTFRVRSLNDTPTGYPTALDFTDLCEMYYDYITVTAQMAQSSSESSSSSSSSSSNSSSSSSIGRSSSSSSSSIQYSSSSSSSNEYSSSSIDSSSSSVDSSSSSSSSID